MPGPSILIVYSGHSTTGSTATLAGYIREGAASRHGASVVVVAAANATAAQLTAADAVILGSGDYNGDVEPSMLTLFDVTLAGAEKLHTVDLHDRVGAAFCTSAFYAGGAQPVLNTLIRQLMKLGATIVGSGSFHSSQGLCAQVVDSTASHPVPGGWAFSDTKYLEDDAKAFGARIADIASFFKPQFVRATGAPAQPGHALTCPVTPTGWTQGGTSACMSLGLWVATIVILLTAVLATGLAGRRR